MLTDKMQFPGSSRPGVLWEETTVRRSRGKAQLCLPSAGCCLQCLDTEAMATWLGRDLPSSRGMLWAHSWSQFNCAEGISSPGRRIGRARSAGSTPRSPEHKLWRRVQGQHCQICHHSPAPASLLTPPRLEQLSPPFPCWARQLILWGKSSPQQHSVGLAPCWPEGPQKGTGTLLAWVSWQQAPVWELGSTNGPWQISPRPHSKAMPIYTCTSLHSWGSTCKNSHFVPHPNGK